MTIQDIDSEALLSHPEARFTHDPYSGLPLADTRHVLAFTIPLPPPANNAYPTNFKTGRRYLTGRGKAFKQIASVDARIAMIESGWQPGAGPLGLRLRLWFPNKRRTDLDGRIKLTQDSIADGLGVDDSIFNELHVYRAGVSAEPRCEVSVWPI